MIPQRRTRWVGRCWGSCLQLIQVADEKCGASNIPGAPKIAANQVCTPGGGGQLRCCHTIHTFPAPARPQCILGCCQSGCSSGLIALRRPNGSAALICVSGWKRDLSLPKQRGSEDRPEGPIRHHYCLFRLFRSLFVFLTLSQCWRSSSQAESSLINVSDHSALCVFQPFFAATFAASAINHGRVWLANRSVAPVYDAPPPQPAEPLNQFQVQFKA